jgi:hypothetical protein
MTDIAEVEGSEIQQAEEQRENG